MRIGFFYVISALVAGVMVCPAVSAPLSFTPDAFGVQFNDTATRLGVTTRIALRTCGAGGGPSCTYQTSTGVYCIVFSEDHSTIHVVECIAAEKGAVDDLLMSFFVLATLFYPPISSDERMVAFRTMNKRFNDSGGKRGEAFLRDVTYILARMEGIGFSLTANSKLP